MGMEGQCGGKGTVWGAMTLKEEGESKTSLFYNLPTRRPPGAQESPLHLFPPQPHFLLSLKNQSAIFHHQYHTDVFTRVKGDFCEPAKKLTSLA